MLGPLFSGSGWQWGEEEGEGEVVRAAHRESLSWGSGLGNCAAVCLNNLGVIGLFEMPEMFGKVGEGRLLDVGQSWGSWLGSCQREGWSCQVGGGHVKIWVNRSVIEPTKY